MTDAMWVVLVLGLLVGIWIGRRLAEDGRARYDMKRTWDGRRNYRDG
jgi:uncharacterized membrane-anchored protein YhcB (DUF1043 family)